MLEPVGKEGEVKDDELIAINVSPEQMNAIITQQAEAIQAVSDESPAVNNAPVVVFREIPGDVWAKISNLPGKQAAKILQAAENKFPIAKSQLTAIGQFTDKIRFDKKITGAIERKLNQASSFAERKFNITKEEAEMRAMVTGVRNLDLTSRFGLDPVLLGAFIVLTPGLGPLVVLPAYAASHLIGSAVDTTILVTKHLHSKSREKTEETRRNQALESLFSTIYFSERAGNRNPADIKKELETLVALYDFNMLSRKGFQAPLSDHEKARRLELKVMIKRNMEDPGIRQRMKEASIYSTLLSYMASSADTGVNEALRQKYSGNVAGILQKLGAGDVSEIFSGSKPEDIPKMLNELVELENALKSARRKIWPLKHIILSGLIPFLDYHTVRDLMRILSRKAGSNIRGAGEAVKSVFRDIAGGPQKASAAVKWMPVKVFRFGSGKGAEREIMENAAGASSPMEMHQAATENSLTGKGIEEAQLRRIKSLVEAM